MSKTFLLTAAFTLFCISCTHQPAPPLQARIPSSSSSQQQQVDEQCFVNYSQAAGRCNTEAGENDLAFDRCLAPVKVDFRKCCRIHNGSPECGSEAPAPTRQQQKAVDDMCFVAYSQAAGRCNSSSSNDSTFMGCLRPIKAELKTCCLDHGGSADCAADAR